MAGGLPTDLLIRAYQRFFRAKDSPNIPAEMLGVVVMDDNSKGPYPPYRSWYAGFPSPQLAGNYSYIWVVNEDGPPGTIAPTGGGKSAVVVDEVRLRAENAIDDFALVISVKGLIIGGTKTNVCAASDEMEPMGVTGNPRMANVSIQALQQVPALFNPTQRLPASNVLGTVATVKGPFILMPNMMLLVSPLTQNNGLFAFFRGRYYPPQ